MSSECSQAAFDLATALVFNKLNPSEGFGIYKALSETGNSEAAVAAGVVLVEGLLGKADPTAEEEQTGLSYIQKAVAVNNPQAQYELATLHYLGNVLPEDEKQAFIWFRAAAEQKHTGAQYMVLFTRKAILFIISRNRSVCYVAHYTHAVKFSLQVGDALLEGCGCTKTPYDAVEFLYAAAVKGHRSARERILNLLDVDSQEYGRS
jgi:TPR repeat protein